MGLILKNYIKKVFSSREIQEIVEKALLFRSCYPMLALYKFKLSNKYCAITPFHL